MLYPGRYMFDPTSFYFKSSEKIQNEIKLLTQAKQQMKGIKAKSSNHNLQDESNIVEARGLGNTYEVVPENDFTVKNVELYDAENVGLNQDEYGIRRVKEEE